MPKKITPFIVVLCLIFICASAKHSSAQAVAPDPSTEQAPAATNAQINEDSGDSEEDAAAQPAAPTGVPGKTVKSIDIQGNKSIGIAQVLAKIKTRVGQEYQENVVSDDLKRLYNTGHFSDVQIDHEDHQGGYKIIVRLKEKPIVEELTFSKLRYYNKRFLESKIKTKKDKFLDNKTLKDDINTIEELYKKKGLTQAKVDVETFLDDVTNKATLHFIIREGFRMKIKRINIYGNTAYQDKKIIKVMKSRPAWLFNSGFLKEDQLEEDMTRIQSFFEQNGYIDAKAAYKVEPLYKGLVNVDVNIEEGKRYYVGDVAVTGNSILSELDIKSNLKNMREANVFSREKLDEDVNNVRNAYFDRGYISANVEEATSFNTETGNVDVKLDIKEGKLAYINKIKIQGNAHTRDIVIRRELRMYPGDQFDGKKLRKSKERLRNLGYFEDVGYDIEDTDQADQKDLVVQVKEAKTGSFSFGGGYSTVDKLVGFIELEQKNFDIANWPSFTGGGQNLRLRGELGSTRQNVLLSFTEPWLFDYPVSGGFDAFLTDTKRDSSTGYAYDERRTGGDLRLGKSFNDNFNIGSYYRLEQIKINNLDSAVSADLAAEEGTNVVSSSGLSGTHDYRDSPISPTTGWMIANNADLAGGLLGGDKDFYRLQTSGNYYIPIKFSELTTVMELNARTGMVKAYGDSDRVPIFERYFAGGAHSIRGYNERKVGPLDPNTNDSVGGEVILVGGAEYTVPIIDILKAAVFFDTGNVWSKVKDYGSGGLKSGTGLGLRVKTPIGPINLDYGFPLNNEPGEEKRSGKFYFSVSRGF
ncbi:MAG: outer membrane protein assembly factor BamA [Candidatus Omnitrophica bacterium]|nr:outer membrane protein assembly factor BamA [Candidatus Omnitrophota bacterium]